MDQTFIFDLDDTLMNNQHDYTYPQLDFVKFVVNRIGNKAPDAQTIINLQVNEDLELLKSWKKQGKAFSKERFPTSFRNAYEKICSPLGIKDKKGKEKAYEIGKKAFDGNRWRKQGLVSGAEDVLDFLNKEYDELILLTKGDKEIQKRKINSNNLEDKFDKTIIVPFKDKETLEEVISDRDRSFVWHVGNSIKSDVFPAYEAGIGMIYIPCETWAWEKKHHGLPDYQRLIKIENIKDIKNIYDELWNFY